MVHKLISFFLFFFCLHGFAQSYSIQGKILDQNNAPIPYANVVLKTSTDSLFVKGTSTNEMGLFEIENVNIENYILEVSYIGYSKHVTRIEVKNDLTISEIILVEDFETIEGVTVTAKRPTVKRLVDRLVFNVENSTLSNNNVLDVLKQTPGVLVHDGSIRVKNSTPTVYINDRRVHLSSDEVQQLLEGTSASNVKSIEVITNPPAKYDAEGGAILNIVTSKNIIAGYNGSVFGNYNQGSEFPKYSFGTSHFFKTKKLNTYINYNIGPRKDFRNRKESVNFFDSNNDVSTSWNTNYNRVQRRSNNNVNINIDYDIDKNNTLSLSSNMLISPRNNTKMEVSSLTDVFNSSQILDSLFDTSNNSVNEVFNLAFTLNYVHRLKKQGEKLTVSAHYTNYDYSTFQDVNTNYFFPNNTLIRKNKFQTFSEQLIKLYTAQIDYELPIDKSSKFEAGSKVSNIASESILTQYIFPNDLKIEDMDNSDLFLYDESNYAAYFSYSKDWTNWNLKLGLRGEFTDIKGNSIATSQINNNDYFKFFPSLHIMNKLNDNNEIYFNYNKRIYRPRYAELNPFKYFLNDNTFLQGDPNLRPEIDDSFILGYTFNQKYTFELYYRYEKDPAIEITFQENDNKVLKRLNTNIDHNISYGLDFTTYTQIINNWSLYFLSSIFYYENNYFALESNNELLKNDNWNFYAQIANYFNLLKDKSLSLDVMYTYISSELDGPVLTSDRASLDINFRKNFWGNRASLSVGITDVFNTKNFTESLKYLNQDVYVDSSIENRLFVFGFNYKFGNFRLKNNKNEIRLNERDRI